MRKLRWSLAVMAVVCATAAATVLRNTPTSPSVSNEKGEIRRSSRRFNSSATSRINNTETVPAPYNTESTGKISSRTSRTFTKSDRSRTRSGRTFSSRDPLLNSTIEPRHPLEANGESSEQFSSRNNFSRSRKKPTEVKQEANDRMDRTETVTIPESDRSRGRHRQNYRHTMRQLSLRKSTTTERNNEQIVSTDSGFTKSTQYKRTQANSPSTVQFRPRVRSKITTERIETSTMINTRSRDPLKEIGSRKLTDHIPTGSDISERTFNSEVNTEKLLTGIKLPRKLRFKVRLPDNEIKSASQDIIEKKEVTDSSQNIDLLPSHENMNTSTKISSDNENNLNSHFTTTQRPKKVFVRQPLSRRKSNHTRLYTASSKIIQKTSEISEDDNYPESFKALLQAKNTSPQQNSTTGESLSVKASQIKIKSHPPPLQSATRTTLETPSIHGRFYKENENKESEKELGAVPATEEKSDVPKYKARSDVKQRTSYTPRYRKSSSFNPSTTTTSSPTSLNSERTRYKYSRKFKTSATPSLKEINSLDNKITTERTLVTKYFSRQRNSKLDSSKRDNPNITKQVISTNKAFSSRPTYFSRTKSSFTNVASTTEKYINLNETQPELVPEILASTERIQQRNDTVLNIFKENEKNNIEDLKSSLDITDSTIQRNKEVDNDINVNTNEESESIEFHLTKPTTSKYHSNYKDERPTSTQGAVYYQSTAAPIKNLQSRPLLKRKQKDTDLLTNDLKSKDKDLLKHSNIYSMSTTAFMNGITPEPDKFRGRYSSKYRGPIDRPMYRATVPTITPTNAWLKFYVTDKQLTQPFLEPHWLDHEEQSLTTPMVGRYIIASSPIIHDPYIDLVEGEETILGPGMNAISFSRTRSTLTSADLKLSESVLRSANVMNVEASQHSPSVTVSIFDALADILTSTPKPKLSTTTEVIQKNIHSDVSLQTLNGVSKKNQNKNTMQESNDEESTVSSTTLNTQYTTVQVTDGTTHSVNNNVVVGVNNLPMVEFKEKNLRPHFALDNPEPISTTPIYLRKPFAVKVLYSDPDLPPDTLLTASNWEPTSDNPPTVYNKLPDLSLSNNNFVPLDITNKLSNNIKNILENMDVNNRSKLSLNMERILKVLIPRALDAVSASSINIPDTTPYSLEEIRDTEFNLNFNSSTILNESSIATDNNTINDLSQTISSVSNVDIKNSTVESGVSVNGSNSSIVNSPISNNSVNIYLNENINLSETKDIESGNTSVDLLTTTPIIEVIVNATNIEPEQSINNDNLTTEGKVLDADNAAVIIPKPFFTNFQVNNNDLDYTSSTKTVINSGLKNIIENETFTLPASQPAKLSASEPSVESTTNIWLLSKKARVLNMIEDLIKQHNLEIATAPNLSSSEIINDPIPVSSLSDRLTQMVLDLKTTTTNELTNFNNFDRLNNDLRTTTASGPTELPIVTSTPIADISTDASTLVSFDMPELNTDETTTILNSFQDKFATNATISDDEDLLNTSLSIMEVNSITTISPDENMDTLSSESETTTMVTFDTTIEDETEAIVDPLPTTTLKNNVINTSGTTEKYTPKKDYVIFGILPNNTVVRKDPNDNVLESLTEASPYIIYGVLPNNTIIRKFPNGTRVPRVMQKIDILPISPWNLRNPYSPIHNNPAIVKPRTNPTQIITNITPSTRMTNNNGSEKSLTTNTVNNTIETITTTTNNTNDISTLGITTVANKLLAEISTASHVLSLRTSTMQPSVKEILLNSISLAAKEDLITTAVPFTTHEPRVLTLDIDPETKQIRTEKPNSEIEGTVFKFIPIDEVTISPQDSNVLKLAITKLPLTLTTSIMDTSMKSTESNIEETQIANGPDISADITTTMQTNVVTPITTQETLIKNTDTSVIDFNMSVNPISSTSNQVQTTYTPLPENPYVTDVPIATITDDKNALTTSNTLSRTINSNTRTSSSTIEVPRGRSVGIDTEKQNSNENLEPQVETRLGSLISNTKNLPHLQNDAKLIQALLLATGSNMTIVDSKSTQNNIQNGRQQNITTFRPTSLEDEIKQFEEDIKLLKALLTATGQNPANFNIPTIDVALKEQLSIATTSQAPTTETPTSTTINPDNSFSTLPINIQMHQDIKGSETTVINSDYANLASFLTTNIIPLDTVTTSFISDPTDSTTSTSTESSMRLLTQQTVNVDTSTRPPNSLLPLSTTLQYENPSISTTARPLVNPISVAQRAGSQSRDAKMIHTQRFTSTTETPRTSTFSVEEDLAFLKNLKGVISTDSDDPETALANRIIALAVERSLNEIEDAVVSTTVPSTTTTTTTALPPTTLKTTPSIEDDIRQFQEDTKLLQALLKATGQDSSKFNIPGISNNELNNVKVNSNTDLSNINNDLNQLGNLLATPSVLNEPFDSLTKRPLSNLLTTTSKPKPVESATSPLKEEEIQNLQEDPKFLQSLIKLQGKAETVTQKNKLAISGLTSDEALSTLLKQTYMVPEATRAPMSVSTEYGKSNDALLAALLKEQGFGPTTASSLDEQIRLAALLNQVVVTPKARRTTTTVPPPPRRPVMDGLAWLWQQWRETAPGPPRPNRRPSPTTSSSSNSNSVNWFGSGPFVGNAPEKPNQNRIPLEPPGSVTAEQTPGRGQLVSAAINVSRAFSQFLGAAIQGAAQTVQNVIKAGQRAASDVYSNGSG